MIKNIALIYGDGIGPEVTRQSVRALDALARRFGHQFVYTECLMGAEAIDKTGDPLPPDTLEVCLESDAILFGAIGHPKYDNDPSAKVRPEQGLLKLRKWLELYANVRPVTVHPSLAHLSPLKAQHLEGVDMVIYRELTGGIYFGKKTLSRDGAEASDLCSYTKPEIERIARAAYEAARGRRKRLTLVDKANVLETSRLWRTVVRALSEEYSDVETDYLFVDNAAMQLLLQPARFDVVLTDNMFGDILSDEASVLAGSLGLLPSASLGTHTALFEPIHGSFPQAAGKDIANPVGSLLSAALMLDYLGLPEEAALLREAVAWTLGNGFVTKDIDPVNYYFTSTVGELVQDYILGRIPASTNRDNIELRKSTLI